jgi:hypothetical protein
VYLKRFVVVGRSKESPAIISSMPPYRFIMDFSCPHLSMLLVSRFPLYAQLYRSNYGNVNVKSTGEKYAELYRWIVQLRKDCNATRKSLHLRLTKSRPWRMSALPLRLVGKSIGRRITKGYKSTRRNMVMSWFHVNAKSMDWATGCVCGASRDSVSLLVTCTPL